MAELLRVQIKQEDIDAAKNLLLAVPRAWPKVSMRAINHVAAKAKTRIIRDLGLLGSFKARTLRGEAIHDSETGEELGRTGRVRMARATVNNQYATIWVGSYNVRVSELKGTRVYKHRGVSFMRLGSRVHERSGFETHVPAGGSWHYGIFKRRGPKRIPIDELEVPGPAAVYKAAGLESDAHTLSQRELRERIDHEIKAVLMGYVRKGRWER